MADFTTNQTAMAAARSALDRAQLAATQAAARAQQAQSALDGAVRQQNANLEGGGDLAQLQAAAKQAAAQRDAAKAALQRSRAAVSEVGAQFAEFSDPRRNVERLSDSAPFLLFPVRIETRFRTIAQNGPAAAVAPPRHQLWVRIYPDDCSIDTFEPMLSQSELTNVKNYWMNIWRA
ncbi:MAG: hypothetical protein ACXVZZ_09045, partial [Terriglobales bacterium]